MEQLDKMDQNISTNERCNSVKLTQLQEVLSEKDATIKNLTWKLQEMQKKHSISTEEKNNIALAFNEMEIKYKEFIIEHQSVLNIERKDKQEMERRLLEERGSLKEENFFLKQQIQELKNTQTHLEDQVMKLKATISKLEKQSELQESNFQDQLSLLTGRHAETLRENELLRKNEITRLREEFSDIEANLMQKIMYLESQKGDLEQELIKEKALFTSEKVQFEKMIDKMKTKMNSDKELLQETLQTMYEIKAKSIDLDLELVKECHRTERLQLCLENKDAEMAAAVEKVKLEVADQLKELSHTKSLLLESQDEVETLKKQIKDMGVKSQEELKSKDDTIENLNIDVQMHKKKIKEIVETMTRHAAQFQMKCTSYLNSVKHISNLEVSQSGDAPH